MDAADPSMLEAAASALVTILDPQRLVFLVCGVALGLLVGILPGIGGTAGTALLLPFTFGMDPATAFAFLLGLGAVNSIGDTIPAVLFGVAGGASGQATVLDGHQMARRGEGGRALSAAYSASLMGGLFGALLLGVSIPLFRPILTYVQSPQLLALSLFGISMVALLSGSTPLRGLAAAGFGILLALVGSDPSTGTSRWTFGTLYLYDGLPLVPVALGLFALPELADLAVRRTAFARGGGDDVGSGMRAGLGDALRNWFLILRCSWLGALLGAIPGIGSSVVDWIAYGHAMSTEKGARRTFGTGDVRGVIAPEAAVCAKDGGALVPTIVFGVPGSSSMAILLVAFIAHGLVPGPDMITRNLEITYSMVWSLAIANVFGAGICFLLSRQLAKIALIPFSIIIPVMLSLIVIGAFEGNRSWGDLYVLLTFGLIGWLMKQTRWPRPPLILGLVLGGMIERYLFIATTRYGTSWLLGPLVIVLLTLAAIVFLVPLVRQIREFGGVGTLVGAFGRPRLRASTLFGVVLLAVTGYMVSEVDTFARRAQLVPELVGWTVLVVVAASLALEAFRRPATSGGRGVIHMDLVADHDGLAGPVIGRRLARFFVWLLAFFAGMATVGVFVTMLAFIGGYMRLENREPWVRVLMVALGATVFAYLVFDRMLSIPWPPTLIADLVPAARSLDLPGIR